MLTSCVGGARGVARVEGMGDCEAVPRRGLVFKAHILLHHSTLGLRVIKKKDGGQGCETLLMTSVKYTHTGSGSVSTTSDASACRL